MQGPGLLQMFAVLALAVVTAAIPSPEVSSPTQDLIPGVHRAPRWFWETIRNALPTQNSISNRVSDTFSRTSLDEAASVLLPLRDGAPLQCRTTDDDIFKTGICVSVGDCYVLGGVSHGSCGGIVGTCCVVERQCNSNSNSYVTHFTNPRYPTPTSGTGECKLTVNPAHSNICQFRLDLEEFDIVGPDESSNCVTDFMGVTGGTSTPKLCGDLTGQHLYINVKPASGPIELSMDTATTLVETRSWNVKITQIPCDAPEKAPPGCLQFFNKTSGTIKSFNFMNALPDEGFTRQLKNLAYGICINSKVGYCELTWTASRDGDFSFTMTGDATVDPNMFMTEYGTDGCTRDYVNIPGGYYEDDTGRSLSEERFCGTKFPTRVRTKAQPYRLYVNSDSNEEGDVRNTGFALDFRHSLC